jgi:Amt family ammonium transporter
MLWFGVVTWLLLKVLDITLGLRVSDEQESEGLDLAEHGERGYSH